MNNKGISLKLYGRKSLDTKSNIVLDNSIKMNYSDMTRKQKSLLKKIYSLSVKIRDLENAILENNKRLERNEEIYDLFNGGEK